MKYTAGIDLTMFQLPSQRSRDKAPLRKFSTMIKRMVIELDRDPNLYPDGNIIEVWTLARSSDEYSYPVIVAPCTRLSQSRP